MEHETAIKEIQAQITKAKNLRDVNQKYLDEKQNLVNLYAEAVREVDEKIASLEAAVRKLQGVPDETIVWVPGSLTAHYAEGGITHWVFMPHEADAGYFGEPTAVVEGDQDLDVRDQDGPFWEAVRQSFDGENFTAKWVC